MDYCGPRGIPHSQFLGWDEDDQEKALWWAARQAQRCGTCGHHPDERSPKADRQWCPGCYALDVARAQIEKERGNGVPHHGVHVVLTRPQEGGEHAREEG